jgi:tRNA pseudouridine55 synthase
MSELNGVLPVDKPEGPTSHDAVSMARRALGMRRIGHTGTLDPFASGLLLLCLGPATRLSEYLTALPKRYSATLLLGMTTDTDDRTGQALQTDDGWRALSRAAVEGAVQSQVGSILQRPPTYSAKKVDGERMYAAARRGAPVARDPVPVFVDAIRILRYEPPEVDLQIDCGSGTYIRAIARDVGEALGVGAHLTRLRRTGVGSFEIEHAITVERLGDPAAVETALLPPAAALAHLPAVTLLADQVQAVLHGRAVESDLPVDEDRPLALLAPDHQLVAIGERSGAVIRPRKVFV